MIIRVIDADGSLLREDIVPWVVDETTSLIAQIEKGLLQPHCVLSSSSPAANSSHYERNASVSNPAMMMMTASHSGGGGGGDHDGGEVSQKGSYAPSSAAAMFAQPQKESRQQLQSHGAPRYKRNSTINTNTAASTNASSSSCLSNSPLPITLSDFIARYSIVIPRIHAANSRSGGGGSRRSSASGMGGDDLLASYSSSSQFHPHRLYSQHHMFLPTPPSFQDCSDFINKRRAVKARLAELSTRELPMMASQVMALRRAREERSTWRRDGQAERAFLLQSLHLRPQQQGQGGQRQHYGNSKNSKEANHGNDEAARLSAHMAEQETLFCQHDAIAAEKELELMRQFNALAEEAAALRATLKNECGFIDLNNSNPMSPLSYSSSLSSSVVRRCAINMALSPLQLGLRAGSLVMLVAKSEDDDAEEDKTVADDAILGHGYRVDGDRLVIASQENNKARNSTTAVAKVSSGSILPLPSTFPSLFDMSAAGAGAAVDHPTNTHNGQPKEPINTATPMYEGLIGDDDTVVGVEKGGREEGKRRDDDMGRNAIIATLNHIPVGSTLKDRFQSHFNNEFPRVASSSSTASSIPCAGDALNDSGDDDGGGSEGDENNTMDAHERAGSIMTNGDHERGERGWGGVGGSFIADAKAAAEEPHRYAVDYHLHDADDDHHERDGSVSFSVFAPIDNYDSSTPMEYVNSQHHHRHHHNDAYRADVNVGDDDHERIPPTMPTTPKIGSLAGDTLTVTTTNHDEDFTMLDEKKKKEESSGMNSSQRRRRPPVAALLTKSNAAMPDGNPATDLFLLPSSSSLSSSSAILHLSYSDLKCVDALVEECMFIEESATARSRNRKRVGGVGFALSPEERVLGLESTLKGLLKQACKYSRKIAMASSTSLAGGGGGASGADSSSLLSPSSSPPQHPLERHQNVLLEAVEEAMAVVVSHDGSDDDDDDDELEAAQGRIILQVLRDNRVTDSSSSPHPSPSSSSSPLTELFLLQLAKDLVCLMRSPNPSMAAVLLDIGAKYQSYTVVSAAANNEGKATITPPSVGGHSGKKNENKKQKKKGDAETVQTADDSPHENKKSSGRSEKERKEVNEPLSPSPLRKSRSAKEKKNADDGKRPPLFASSSAAANFFKQRRGESEGEGNDDDSNGSREEDEGVGGGSVQTAAASGDEEKRVDVNGWPLPPQQQQRQQQSSLLTSSSPSPSPNPSSPRRRAKKGDNVEALLLPRRRRRAPLLSMSPSSSSSASDEDSSPSSTSASSSSSSEDSSSTASARSILGLTPPNGNSRRGSKQTDVAEVVQKKNKADNDDDDDDDGSPPPPASPSPDTDKLKMNRENINNSNALHHDPMLWARRSQHLKQQQPPPPTAATKKSDSGDGLNLSSSMPLPTTKTMSQNFFAGAFLGSSGADRQKEGEDEQEHYHHGPSQRAVQSDSPATATAAAAATANRVPTRRLLLSESPERAWEEDQADDDHSSIISIGHERDGGAVGYDAGGGGEGRISLVGQSRLVPATVWDVTGPITTLKQCEKGSDVKSGGGRALDLFPRLSIPLETSEEIAQRTAEVLGRGRAAADAALYPRGPSNFFSSTAMGDFPPMPLPTSIASPPFDDDSNNNASYRHHTRAPEIDSNDHQQMDDSAAYGDGHLFSSSPPFHRLSNTDDDPSQHVDPFLHRLMLPDEPRLHPLSHPLRHHHHQASDDVYPPTSVAEAVVAHSQERQRRRQGEEFMRQYEQYQSRQSSPPFASSLPSPLSLAVGEGGGAASSSPRRRVTFNDTTHLCGDASNSRWGRAQRGGARHDDTTEGFFGNGPQEEEEEEEGHQHHYDDGVVGRDFNDKNILHRDSDRRAAAVGVERALWEGEFMSDGAMVTASGGVSGGGRGGGGRVGGSLMGGVRGGLSHNITDNYSFNSPSSHNNNADASNSYGGDGTTIPSFSGIRPSNNNTNTARRRNTTTLTAAARSNQHHDHHDHPTTVYGGGGGARSIASIAEVIELSVDDTTDDDGGNRNIHRKHNNNSSSSRTNADVGIRSAITDAVQKKRGNNYDGRFTPAMAAESIAEGKRPTPFAVAIGLGASSPSYPMAMRRGKKGIAAALSLPHTDELLLGDAAVGRPNKSRLGGGVESEAAFAMPTMSVDGSQKNSTATTTPTLTMSGTTLMPSIVRRESLPEGLLW